MTSTEAFWVGLLLGVFVVALIGAGLAGWAGRESRRRERQLTEYSNELSRQVAGGNAQTAKVHHALRAGVRYEVRLADWGEDFAHPESPLPRWRWVILDADRAVKEALGENVGIGSEQMPFMLGNAPTPLSGVAQAMRWIKEQDHPLMQVIFDEGIKERQMRVVTDENGLSHGEPVQ